MCASFRQIGRKSDTLHVNLAGKGSYFLWSLPQRKDVIANNCVMVGGTRLPLFQIRSVGIVSQVTGLYARLNELVNRNIHVELQKGGNLYIEFGTYRRDTLLEHPVIEERGTRACNIILVFDDATSLDIGYDYVHDHIVVIHALLDKRGGVDILALHLSLCVLRENPHLQVGQFIENLIVV